MSEKDENVVSMEQLLVRKVTKRGGGQASGGDQDQPAEITTTEQTSEVRVTIHEEAIETDRGEKLKKIWEALAEKTQKKNSKPKIQKVPFMLRDHKNFDKYYKPRVVALGPYHHGKQKYLQAEKVKLQLTGHYINYIHDQNITDDTLLKKIEDNIKELRECYDEEATKNYNDKALAWMLFVDGCSTLEFIRNYPDFREFEIKRDQVVFAKHDMFLLENQLPYQLLQLLMSSSKKNELEKSIEGFVKSHGLAPDDQAQTQKNAEPTHLLGLLLKTMARPSSNTDGKGKDRSHSFRNVQELQAAGIHFRPSERDISFKTKFLFSGFLYLPKIKVDDSMGPKFMNLIAYEMCPDFENDFVVTSYIGFLDSLIDHPDDVKHLRKRCILHNLLGSDEEVAQLFNEIGTDLVPNGTIYSKVEEQIETHYQTKWKTWMAQFFHDHFSSPWTFLAFIGVLLGLGLSGIQTWYATNSDPSPCDDVCKYLKTHPR